MQGFAGKGKVLLSTHLDREEAVLLDSLYLRPDEGVIISLSEGTYS
jgi:hypothetical protein